MPKNKGGITQYRGDAGIKRQKAAEEASGIKVHVSKPAPMPEPDEIRSQRFESADSKELRRVIQGEIGKTAAEHMAYGEKKTGIKITRNPPTKAKDSNKLPSTKKTSATGRRG